jgi:hypothetical protein
MSCVENALKSLKLGCSGELIYKGPVALKSSDISTARGEGGIARAIHPLSREELVRATLT